MNTLEKFIEHLIYAFRKEHIHEQPVPLIFKDRPLVWTPPVKKGKK